MPVAALTCAGRWNHLGGRPSGYIPLYRFGRQYRQAAFQPLIYEPTKPLWTRLATLERLDAQSVFSEVYTALGQYLMPDAPQAKWGVSMPRSTFSVFEIILQTYPQAKIVYIMRDMQEVLYAHSKEKRSHGGFRPRRRWRS